MSDEKNVSFTPEEISQQARANVALIGLAADAYLKEQGLSGDDFWAFAGRGFAPSWTQGMTAIEVAKGAALNMLSAGCKLRSLSGDDTQAQAVLGDWPFKRALELFELNQEEADAIWNVFGPIAESLGYVYQWNRQGDEVTMTFSSPSK